MSRIVLTLDQIRSLYSFAEGEGQSAYIITDATVPALEADDGSVVPEYTGLIVYSESEQSGVLQLADK
ncbi:hypothetical protein HV265_13030 [Citrobacter sp. RHBSTW-00678]|uniref:hypothetical protein n=1 Tax=Citrobacter sp. RHBSTW-00678 TaxID=2742661 RepID=UPI0015E905E8|nr:hypothetical protein [Citrobacter sp. RHBSTW-00678]QLV87840.1 hypothetical protein HV265_13030 [Citrobacter sp. RHBSTW-00678]